MAPRLCRNTHAGFAFIFIRIRDGNVPGNGICEDGPGKSVFRRAANMVAHRLARNETVRICLGGAFTKDNGERNLVRRAEKVIAIEGSAYIGCVSGALMKVEYLSMLQAAGFAKAEIVKDSPLKDSPFDFASMIRDLGFPVD